MIKSTPQGILKWGSANIISLGVWNWCIGFIGVLDVISFSTWNFIVCAYSEINDERAKIVATIAIVDVVSDDPIPSTFRGSNIDVQFSFCAISFVIKFRWDALSSRALAKNVLPNWSRILTIAVDNKVSREELLEFGTVVPSKLILRMAGHWNTLCRDPLQKQQSVGSTDTEWSDT